MMTYPKGEIRKNLTIWCGGCGDWTDCGNTTVRQSAAEARRGGWNHTEKYGWLCPTCVQERE